ncbi:MAG: hypothetical protein O9295_18980 [Microcystis sp. LE18-22.4A]|nr:hypothetical protein [Microcystis sp. LE18-22.4A]MCZ8120069.1 hypothetical protein [Microcystis sp. LE18-22.4A]
MKKPVFWTCGHRLLAMTRYNCHCEGVIERQSSETRFLDLWQIT